MMKKKVISLLSAISVLFLSMSLPVIATEASNGVVSCETISAGDAFTVIQENDRISLSVDVSTANFAVADKESKKVWYAFSPEIENNDSLSKNAKKSLQSMVNVSYYNADGNLVSVGSFSHSVEDGTFVIKKIKKGIKLIFRFDREGEKFVVPIEVTLDEDSVKCKIPYDEVEENKNALICDLHLLPNFGCGFSSDSGYALIPDGSGAIINFSDAVYHDSRYEEQIYGKDMSQDLVLYDTHNKQNIRMPVYGIKNGDAAFLAIITDADSSASIIAETLSGYTTCSASFVYHESDLTGIQSKNSGRRIVTLTDEKPLTVSPVVEYKLLGGDKADYSGMAEIYRSYLVEKYNLKKLNGAKQAALNLEIFGGVREDHMFAGISFSRIKAVTTLSQVLKMQKDFKELGDDTIKWTLYGFTKGGYCGDTVLEVKLQSKLGNKKQLNKIGENAGKENVYLSFDFVRMYNHSWQSFKNKNLVKSLNGLMVERHFSLLSNGTQKEKFGYWNYYNCKAIDKFTEKLINNYPDSFGIMYTNMGEELYTDFRKENPTSRNSLMTTYQKSLKKTADKKISIGVESGNTYSLFNKCFISEIPTSSSSFDIESFSVPFYAMVLHGYVQMSIEPLNDDSTYNEKFLKAMETGTAITYRLTGCNPYELKDTKLNFIYKSEYNVDLREKILSQASELASWQNKIANQCIISNEKKDNLSITLFENGNKIIVNYTDMDGWYNGQKIGANSYIIVENE